MGESCFLLKLDVRKAGGEGVRAGPAGPGRRGGRAPKAAFAHLPTLPVPVTPCCSGSSCVTVEPSLPVLTHADAY